MFWSTAPCMTPLEKNSTSSQKTKPTSLVCCLTKNYARKELTQWPEQSMQSSLSTKAQRPFTILLNFTLAQEPVLSFKFVLLFLNYFRITTIVNSINVINLFESLNP